MAFLNYTGLQRFLAKLKTIFVGDIAYDATGKALTKTVNGVASDIISTAALKRDMNLSKSDVGLDNVDNKSSATIREEITKKNVTDALGTGAGTVKYLREDGEWGTPITSVNGEGADGTGNLEVARVPFADNLTADDAQSSFGEFIARTTGGDASLSDGDAWLSTIKGRRVHNGYAAASVQMTVTPVPRVAPADITAVINESTFKTEVGDTYGNYRFSYTGFAWTLPYEPDPEEEEEEGGGEGHASYIEVDLADYGITVSNTPIPGDNILVVYYSQEDPEHEGQTIDVVNMTVNPAPRQADPEIIAVIDNSAFIAAAGDQSGTYTFTYTTAWSTNPASYGITVVNAPVNGDVITVVYAAEDRGVIVMSDPDSFISTGWNLYNHTLGYARVLKYSDTYGFMIGGTYTAVQFSETVSGEKTTITPDANGKFSISKDGYIWVTGGNNTDTFVIMTWSDWQSGPSGAFKAYEETEIDLSGIMTNFPYGLCQVGTVSDIIDFSLKTAMRYIDRMAYSAANLAIAQASGRQYECDDDYIYIVRETPETYAITVANNYTASDHGMEIFEGTSVKVYMESFYGQNLKDKLRTDVVTISAQALSAAQQAQVRTNVGAASASDLSALETQVDGIIQESVFEIEIEDNQYVLYWAGAAGTCPYDVQVDGADFALYFTY